MRALITLVLFLFLSVAHAADIVVDTVVDEFPTVINGQCSLREAITASNTNSAIDSCAAGGSGTDTISFFVPTPATILLKATLTEVISDLTIQGLGPDNLVIDGNGAYRHFAIPNSITGKTLSVEHMTLKNAHYQYGGGSVYTQSGNQLYIDNVVFDSNHSDSSGAAIQVSQSSENESFLQVRRSSFLNNQSDGASGGGAIRIGHNSTVIIEDSTFENNVQTHINGTGGAINMFSLSGTPSDLTVRRSTFFGNAVAGAGSAIAVSSYANLSISHSTIVGNTADSNMDNKIVDNGAINLGSNASLTLENTIVANNIDASSSGTKVPDISMVAMSSVTSLGYNFIGVDENYSGDDFTPGLPNANVDYIGTTAMPLDPLLEALAFNGGTTKTLAVPDPNDTISPVLDKGKCGGQLTDQRYFDKSGARSFDSAAATPSPGGDNCDIGAFEFGAVDTQTDHDFDGVLDNVDNCPSHFNPSQNAVCNIGNDEICFPVKMPTSTALICL